MIDNCIWNIKFNSSLSDYNFLITNCCVQIKSSWIITSWIDVYRLRVHEGRKRESLTIQNSKQDPSEDKKSYP